LGLVWASSMHISGDKDKQFCRENVKERDLFKIEEKGTIKK